MVKGTSNLVQPVALTIAGFDPSSGAGITADLKVFAAHGIYGLAATTALTVQSTQGVRRVVPISPEVLQQTLDCLAEDIRISGIKIGMLATEAMVGTVSSFLSHFETPVERIILDPVVRSSSGHELLSKEGFTVLKTDLIPRIGWITPNMNELSLLVDTPVDGPQAVPDAAARLAGLYPRLNIVVTGGHLDPPNDFLRTAGGATQWFQGERIETKATHGTGCAFSSALLARILIGDTPARAVAAAKTYVAAAMKAARPIGHGPGPLEHFYKEPFYKWS